MLSLENIFTTARKFWVLLAMLALAGTATLVVGSVSPPTIPVINLSADPLFAAAGGDKPVIALALSVEFPTVGAQYLAASGGATDSSYTNINEYLGYYDAESCYTYNNAPTETPAAGLNTSDYKRFDPSGAATSRMCSNAFSGNFLNWASNSAIDMMRLALSGGDRYIDTASLTILQRAVIPNGDPICMWNSSNFPAKQLQKDGGGVGNYWGAVPTAMVTQAAGSDIWVGNTLSRIYFGTSNTGGCGNTGAYILGAPTSASNIGPISTSIASLPGDAINCASEGNTCSFSGTQEVWYGASITTGSGKKAVTVNYWKVAPASNGVSCTNGVFGDPISGAAKTCYTRPYSGSWTPPPSGSALNSDGFFYSRVQVCNVSGSTLQDVRDYGLCKQYPNGNYKPTGSIQKYSDQLRLAAFGYLMDQTASYNPGGRYGGVLRAPMKYVGAKTFNTAGQDNTATGGNPNAEWNSSTGVFNTNPDSDTTQATPISGVINYLNKFGRTGSVAGRYKKYDPVGELHYEVLRYLQGLQPSIDAVSNITTDMYDGFPVSTTWTDPYGGGRSATADYSCLKSNIVTIGDIHTHDGNRLPTASAANNIPDINYWRSTVQSFEKNQAASYIDGQGASQTTGNPNGANNSVPSNTTTSQILGSSYWGHTHDIRGTNWTGSPSLQRPGLRTKSFFFDVNEYGESSVAANRQYGNQFFTAAKYGGFESDSGNTGGKPYNTFGNPFKRQDGTNDNAVWQDAANPGEASTYYLQSSARGVLKAFDSIFSRASTAALSIAGNAIASKNLFKGDTLIYQSSFDTADWTGDVQAFPVTVTAGTTTLGATATWTAASRLGTLAAPASTRNIVVGRSGATAVPVASAFTWAAADIALKDSLARLTPTSTADALGQDRLNYLRGDRSKEGNPFRARSKLLGDIINSGVVYSGAPTAPRGSTPGFAAFKTLNATRTPAVFVGSNDGMLHGFNATTGDELFGYIPSAMIPRLAALTGTDYNGNHRAYVDASPVVAEAKVGATDTASDWKTVLIAGMGGGSSGVFALDVSNPGIFSASNVMWEFTRADDSDMGYVIGRPQIIRLRTSAPNATAVYRSFAAVASGVNNYLPENGNFSATGNPALFLLALDKPAGTAWTNSGSSANYYKITLPVDSLLSVSNPTGLINFNSTFGLKGETEFIYMGDLHGKLWKIDFTKPTVLSPADWSMERLTAYNKGTSAAPIPYPLYTAQTNAGAVQQITMAPLLAAGPVVDGLDTVIVGFGTGKYLEASDNASTNQNSFYAIYDNATSTADNLPAGASIVRSRARLQQGTVINTTALTVTVPAFIYGRANIDTPTTTPPIRSGFYFDFPVSGERMISNGAIFGDNFVLSSLIPASSGAVGSCTAAGGGGNAYDINIDTGNGGYVRSTVGLLGEPLVTILSTVDNPTTSTGQGTKTITYQKFTGGSIRLIPQPTTGATTSTSQTLVNQRMSWRQINNYLDLKNQ